MQKLKQIYEGKAKKVYGTDDPELYIVDYKDDATAFNGLKKGTIAGKGVINNRMSNLLMQMLEKNGIPTHFVRELSERETLVKKVSIVPLEVIVRNIAAGSFSKRYGVAEGLVFDEPVLEFSYKNDALGDPLLNTSHALALKLATPAEIETIKGYAKHEQDTLAAVVNARNAAVSATTPEAKMEADNVLTGALRQLFAVAEAYPDLKANTNFTQLQATLEDTENKVSYARQSYNDCVLSYNNAIQTFPAVIFAGIFQFKERQGFEAAEAARQAPTVKF